MVLRTEGGGRRNHSDFVSGTSQGSRGPTAFGSDRSGHTPQPTALVNEAYLKLVGSSAQKWENRTLFLAFACHIMRQILIDHSRQFHASKGGGGEAKQEWNEQAAEVPARNSSLETLDEALTALGKIDSRKAKTIELKYFGGLRGEEIAVAMEMRTATITRDLRMAEAWLRRYMAGDSAW